MFNMPQNKHENSIQSQKKRENTLKPKYILSIKAFTSSVGIQSAESEGIFVKISVKKAGHNYGNWKSQIYKYKNRGY